MHATEATTARAGHHLPPVRTCRELGVCQHRRPACRPDCRPAHFFAPGVIEPPQRQRRRLTASDVDRIGNAAIWVAVCVVSSAFIGWTLGYYNPWGLFR